MENSKIEWCHHTFNPWIGCTKVSAGCKNCYAEADMDKRRGRTKWGDVGSRSITSGEYWWQPMKWNRDAAAAGERRRVFCASLADVFEDWQGQLVDSNGDFVWWPSSDINELSFYSYRAALTGAYAPVTQDLVRQKLFRLIDSTPHLDWLLLTKRPENIMKMVPEHWRQGFPANVWIGTSVEDQTAADTRVPHLLRVPAAIRFLSCEPLLGPVDLTAMKSGDHKDGPKVHWVIAGGESGTHARPMHPDWARELRDQCQANEIPFLFKQWGEWRQYDHWDGDNARPLGMFENGIFRHGNIVWDFKKESIHMAKVGKKKAGRMLDGREWNEFPNV